MRKRSRKKIRQEKNQDIYKLLCIRPGAIREVSKDIVRELKQLHIG